MSKIKLLKHNEKDAQKLGKKYLGRDAVLFAETNQLISVYNGLVDARRLAAETNRDAISMLMRETENAIDVRIEEINSFFNTKRGVKAS